MITIKRIVSVIVLITFVVMLHLLAACKPEEALPVEEVKGKITIGTMECFTGTQGGLAIATRDGELDAVRYVNERMGGISGHPLDITVLDVKLESASVIPGWDRLESEGVPIILSVVMGALPLVPELSQKSQLSLLTSSPNDMGLVFPTEPCYVFGTFPVPVVSYDVVCDLIEKDWAKNGETRPPKIGFDILSMGNFPKLFGKAARLYSEKRGWEHLVVNTSLRPADVTTQVLQMKQFGADYVYLFNTDNALIAWIKEFDRQNFHPVIYGLSSAGSKEMRNVLGHLSDGVRFYAIGVLWENTDEPITDLVHELNAEWHPEVTYRMPQYMRGFASTLVVAEALKKAVENVGYENLDSETMKEAMETINDFRPAGMRTGYTWTPTDHQGLHAARWYEWSAEGIHEPITDWITFPPLPPEQRIQDWWMQE